MRVAGWLSVLLVLAAGSALADRELRRRTIWDDAHRTIVTDIVFERDDGRVEIVRRTGGSVDGIGMVQLPLYEVGGTITVDYVATRAPKSGTPLRWAKACVYITPDAAGTRDLVGDTEFQIIDTALTTWESATRGCGYLHFIREAPEAGEVGYDGVNSVKFRETRWCRPATANEPEDCYDSQAAAITTLSFVDLLGEENDGIILDADVEINAVHFAVSHEGKSFGDGKKSDLTNTLTHEFGHVIGLDHTCWDRPGTPPTDGKGNPAPLCQPLSALPPAITEATMFNYAPPGDVAKSTLEKDDVDGFCSIYPLEADPNVCAPALGFLDPGCACTLVAPKDKTPQPAVILLAVALLVARRRLRH